MIQSWVRPPPGGVCLAFRIFGAFVWGSSGCAKIGSSTAHFFSFVSHGAHIGLQQGSTAHGADSVYCLGFIVFSEPSPFGPKHGNGI